jgi:transcription antitermination factor NusG
MDVGDRVRIDLDYFEGFFGIIPECPMNFEKHRVHLIVFSWSRHL